MPWQGQKDIATWSSGLIINEAGPQQGKMSWTAVSPDTHINGITAHMHGSLHWAPDPGGLSWLKSAPLQPGGTGEKFTITAAKLFFTPSVFASSFLKRSKEIQDGKSCTFLGFVYSNSLVFSWLSWQEVRECWLKKAGINHIINAKWSWKSPLFVSGITLTDAWKFPEQSLCPQTSLTTPKRCS